MALFKKAEKKKAKLRLALCAPSGAGKTFSALKIAQGLGGRIAMIDTEHGSGELYADMCDYDVLQINPPYTPQKYIDGIRAAEQAGYDTVIVDSLSHAWAGEGGLLEEVDNKTKASRSGNSYTAWRDVTPLHNQLVNAMLKSTCHIIATMRSKVAYEMQKGSNGKLTPVKIGLAPVQREGMDYEFTVVFDISVEGHVATASKDRTSLFDGKAFVPSQNTGKQLVEWLNSGSGFDLKEIRDAMSEMKDIKSLKEYLQSLNVPEGHPQRGDIAELYKEYNVFLTDAQNKQIQAIYSGTERGEKLILIGSLIEREIATTNELTAEEASKVIERSKRIEKENAK